MAAIAHSAAPVLIVDDDQAFSGFVQLVLEGAGYSTLTATTGEDALRIAGAECPLSSCSTSSSPR